MNYSPIYLYLPDNKNKDLYSLYDPFEAEPIYVLRHFLLKNLLHYSYILHTL